MEKYDVEVRVSWSITIEAENEDDAHDQASNIDVFSKDWVNYDIDVTKVD